MNQTTAWFIIKSEEGSCQIQVSDGKKNPVSLDGWGPFDSQEQAIAARIGLIRAGKCKPQ